MKEGHQKNYKNLECTNLTRVLDWQLRLMIWLKKKIEEQLGKATKAKLDPKSRAKARFRKKLCKITKETNLQTRLILNYFHQTPFNHVYMAQSKHIHQKKNFPMWLTVFAIDTPPYGISIYLVDTIYLTLNKNKLKEKTQDHLVCKLKHRKLKQMKYKFHMMSQSFTHQYP